MRIRTRRSKLSAKVAHGVYSETCGQGWRTDRRMRSTRVVSAALARTRACMRMRACACVYHACRVLHVHGRVHARMVRRPQREREYVGRMHPAHSRGYASEGFGRVRDDELVEDEDHGGGEGCEAHERDSPKTMRH